MSSHATDLAVYAKSSSSILHLLGLARGTNDGSRRLDANLEEHELVERIIPLHQQYAGRRCSTKVYLIVVRVGHNAAAIATFCVGHLSGRCKPPETFPPRLKTSADQCTMIALSPTVVRISKNYLT